MSSNIKKPRAAFMEDCDSDDQVVPRSRVSARTNDHSKRERHARVHRSASSKETSPHSLLVVTSGSDKSSLPIKPTPAEALASEWEGRQRSGGWVSGRK